MVLLGCQDFTRKLLGFYLDVTRILLGVGQASLGFYLGFEIVLLGFARKLLGLYVGFIMM